MKSQLRQALSKAVEGADDKVAFLNELREFIHGLSPIADEPVDLVRWVPVEKVIANDYNPNTVAPNEMRLLHVSISHDGYTQPIVTMHDEKSDLYVIVDGFHRHLVMRSYDDIRERTGGYLPVVVLDKDPNEARAATVRHNRARGTHSLTGMSNVVFQMLDNGLTDETVCSELGMETDELVRLKHLTGFAKLFENVDYRRSWETRRQIQIRREWEKTHAGDGAADNGHQAVLEEPAPER